MKKYIILGLTLLMAFPFSAVARDLGPQANAQTKAVSNQSDTWSHC